MLVKKEYIRKPKSYVETRAIVFIIPNKFNV